MFASGIKPIKLIISIIQFWHSFKNQAITGDTQFQVRDKCGKSSFLTVATFQLNHLHTLI